VKKENKISFKKENKISFKKENKISFKKENKISFHYFVKKENKISFKKENKTLALCFAERFGKGLSNSALGAYGVPWEPP
jgi:hypothetical protein